MRDPLTIDPGLAAIVARIGTKGSGISTVAASANTLKEEGNRVFAWFRLVKEERRLEIEDVRRVDARAAQSRITSTEARIRNTGPKCIMRATRARTRRKDSTPKMVVAANV